MHTNNSGYGDKKNKGIRDILGALKQTRPGSHSIVVYPDMVTFREIYVPFVKNQLESGHIVIMLPHYETVDNMKHYLKTQVNVEYYSGSGLLLIIDAKDAFFGDPIESLQNEKGNLVSLMRIAQAQARKLRKDGVVLLVDLGCFFPTAGTDELIKYENSIPQMFRNSTIKQLCMYHQRDFDLRFTPTQMGCLLDQHGRSILMIDP